jgi:amino acid permease
MKKDEIKKFIKRWIIFYIIFYVLWYMIWFFIGYLLAFPKGEEREEAKQDIIDSTKYYYKTLFEKIKVFFTKIIRRILK